MSMLSTWSRRAQEGSLYALLLLLPFSKAAVEVSFGILFLAWMVERLDPKTRADTLWLQPSFRPLGLALLGFLAACALSIPFSTHPRLSVIGFIGKWVEYLLFFVIVADVARRPGVVKRSLRVLVYSAVFVLLEAITQERYGRGFFLQFRLDFFSRMTGPYENPIDLATYLMVIIPILWTFTIIRRKVLRWQVGGLLILLLVCFARTGAIGAWLGLCGGVLLIMATNSRSRKFGLVLLIAVVLGAVFVLGRQGHLGALSVSDIGAVDRMNMWRSAVQMIRDRPVLGQGLNTFMSNYLAYWVGGERQPRYAHNCYLQVAAETGLIGLLTFLVLLGLLFARLVRRLPHLHSNDQMILVGLTTGLFAFVLHAAVDTDFYSLRQAAMFWVFAGLALGLSARQNAQISVAYFERQQSAV